MHYFNGDIKKYQVHFGTKFRFSKNEKRLFAALLKM